MGTIDSKVKYRRQFLPVAKRMMQEGSILQDLADKFGVCISTIRKWFTSHPEFKVAVLAGKDEFDIETVEPALLKAILPHTELETVTVTENDKPVKVTKKVKKMLGNAGEMRQWLGNRDPERWRNTQNVVVEGAEGQEARLRAAIARQTADMKAEVAGKKPKLF